MVTCVRTVDDVLNEHADALGADFVGYRNHVYRVANLCLAIAGQRQLEKVAVAAVFHDLGIWTDGTFDYIAPSIALARDYLRAHAREGWSEEVVAMISNHHKITRSAADPESPIEAFRRALSLEPGNLRARFYLASSYLDAGREGEALEALNEVLRSDPKNVDARLQLGFLHRRAKS